MNKVKEVAKLLEVNQATGISLRAMSLYTGVSEETIQTWLESWVFIGKLECGYGENGNGETVPFYRFRRPGETGKIIIQCL